MYNNANSDIDVIIAANMEAHFSPPLIIKTRAVGIKSSDRLCLRTLASLSRAILGVRVSNAQKRLFLLRL